MIQCFGNKERHLLCSSGSSGQRQRKRSLSQQPILDEFAAPMEISVLDSCQSLQIYRDGVEWTEHAGSPLRTPKTLQLANESARTQTHTDTSKRRIQTRHAVDGQRGESTVGQELPCLLRAPPAVGGATARRRQRRYGATIVAIGGKADMEALDLDLSLLFVQRDYKLHHFSFPDVASPGCAFTVAVDLLESAATDYDLTGQVMWPGARGLGRYVAEHPDVVAGRSVLELGAGVGLAGLCAARYAQSVVLTDGVDEVVELLKRNIGSNSSLVPAAAAAPEAVRVYWPDCSALSLRRFDVVLGADVAYWSSAIRPLFQAVEQSLATDGLFFMGYVSRSKFLDRLLQEVAASVGFTMAVLEEMTDAASGQTVQIRRYSRIGQEG